MQTASILFYIRDSLDDITIEMVDKKLRKVPGVIAPWFNPERNHLLFVYFNPDKTRASVLLNKVRKFGLDAKIIDF